LTKDTCLLLKKRLYLVGVFILLLLSIISSFWIGQYPISLEEYKDVFYYWLNVDLNPAILEKVKFTIIVLEEIRLPRIMAAILIGAALSVSGVVFQGIFVNPLVSPGILGVLAGASFGAALGMLLGQSLFIIQVTAFVFGLLAVVFALFISKFYAQGNTLLMLVLGGVISSSLFGALLSLVKYTADPYNTLPSIVYWLMGSLSSVKLESILMVTPWIVVFIIILISFGKHLNLMSLGEDDARTLGLDVKKVRLLMIFLATILSALSVMLAGMIGWIGLVIPHISRFLVGANHVLLIPMSALLGGTFLLIVDTASRGFFLTEIPLGILTSLIGIPVFLFVLKHSLKS
jgi:iron complex transport system permease protein